MTIGNAIAKQAAGRTALTKWPPLVTGMRQSTANTVGERSKSMTSADVPFAFNSLPI